MSNIAIKVENLSKKYSIGTKASGSLRETLFDSVIILLLFLSSLMYFRKVERVMADII